MLDSGNIDGNNICPAKLLVFNLRTNMIVKRQIIPKEVAQNKTGKGLLITPVIYYEENDDYCQDPTVNNKIYMFLYQINQLFYRYS